MATVPALIIYLHTRMRTEKHTYRFVHNHRHWNRKAVTPIITNLSIAATIPTVSIIVMSSPLAPEDKSLKLSKFQVVHNEGHDYNLLDLMDFFFQIAASFSRWWTMVLTLIMVVTMIISVIDMIVLMITEYRWRFYDDCYDDIVIIVSLASSDDDDDLCEGGDNDIHKHYEQISSWLVLVCKFVTIMPVWTSSKPGLTSSGTEHIIRLCPLPPWPQNQQTGFNPLNTISPFILPIIAGFTFEYTFSSKLVNEISTRFGRVNVYAFINPIIICCRQAII